MAFTFIIGAWIYPLALTLAAATWALWHRPEEHMGFMPLAGLQTMFRLGVGTIVSLAGWLAWALLA